MINYRLYRKDRVKGGGGILIYVSTKLTSRKIKISKEYKNIELLAVEVTIEGTRTIVLGVYRPPRNKGTNYYRILEDELNDVISWATSQCKSIVILGDMNLDRLKPNEREGRILIDLEDVFELTCLINQATRVTPTSNTLLDVILTNDPDLFTSTSGVVELGLSDHKMVYAFAKSVVKHHAAKVINYRSSKHLNLEKFKKDLQEIIWFENSLDQINEQYTHFKTKFMNVVDKHLPLKKMRVRKHDVPYMNAEWKAAIRKKRKYAKKFSKVKSNELWQLMKKWRNEATRLRRKAIKNYWKDVSRDLNENPRNFFGTFMPFINSKCNKDKPDISLNIQGEIQKDQLIVAEEFTNYFSTVADAIGGSEAASLTEDMCNSHPSIEMIRTKHTSNSFHFRTVEKEEVRRVLQGINIHKAAGYDMLPPKILKLVAEELVTPITTLFNQVITQNEWPREWKKGEWVPIFKSEDPLDKVNYRPVTLLIAIDKIFEQIICQQLNGMFGPIFDPFMSAYRKGYSCESTLIRLVEDWRRARDMGHTVGILTTDMSKAFDSMHPILLIAKLKAYGLSKNALDLIISYFTERENRTRVGQETSSWREVSRGCPQGSALGPTLWNIYQNDLFYFDRKSWLSAYADDHQLYYAHEDPEEAILGINEDGKQISDWYSRNFLKGNLKKYQAMILPKTDQRLDIDIDHFRVEQKEEIKLLGVVIDMNLSFGEHISTTCKKASQRIGVLMRLRKLIPVKAKLTIYKTAILPYLTYCSLVWHFCKSSDKRKLERVNERGLRAVFDDWRCPYDELLVRGKLTNLNNRRLQDVAIFMFKVKYGLLPINIINLFSNTPSSYNLRNSDFFIPMFNTVRFGKHSLRYFGPKLWSKLDSLDRQIISLAAFKARIRTKDLTSLTDNSCTCCHLCNT